MSDTAIVAIIAAIPPTLLALAAFITSLGNRKQNAATAVEVTAIKKQTDGLTSALVSTEARASAAEGELKGAKAADAKQVVKDDKAAKSTDGTEQTLHLKNLEVGEGPKTKRKPRGKKT